MAPSEATRAIATMLDAHPYGKSAAAEYIATLAALLVQYPQAIARRCAHPVLGVLPLSDYLPTPAAVRAWLEAEVRSLRWAYYFDQAADRQLRERLRPPPSADEQARVEAGFARLLAVLRHDGAEDTPEAVRARLGLTAEQWAALPDQPEGSTWHQLQQAR